MSTLKNAVIGPSNVSRIASEFIDCCVIGLCFLILGMIVFSVTAKKAMAQSGEGTCSPGMHGCVANNCLDPKKCSEFPQCNPCE